MGREVTHVPRKGLCNNCRRMNDGKGMGRGKGGGKAGEYYNMACMLSEDTIVLNGKKGKNESRKRRLENKA